MSYLDTAKASLEAMRRRRAQPSFDPPSKINGTPKAKQVTGMSLDQFAQAGLIVRVFSQVLGQDILFASDNVSNAALANRTLPIYRAAELRKLALFNPSRKTLRTVHEVKSVFGGSISDVLPTAEIGDAPPRSVLADIT